MVAWHELAVEACLWVFSVVSRAPEVRVGSTGGEDITGKVHCACANFFKNLRRRVVGFSYFSLKLHKSKHNLYH